MHGYTPVAAATKYIISWRAKNKNNNTFINEFNKLSNIIYQPFLFITCAREENVSLTRFNNNIYKYILIINNKNRKCRKEIITFSYLFYFFFHLASFFYRKWDIVYHATKKSNISVDQGTKNNKRDLDQKKN